MDNSFIQEQHARINIALYEFKPGTTNAMYSILHALFNINEVKPKDRFKKTQLNLTEINLANEFEHYIFFTNKQSIQIKTKIWMKPQLYSFVLNIKTKLYIEYSEIIKQYYSNTGINFITNNVYLGGGL